MYEKSERRLAAVMFTDIVGYTSLSQRNESLALELLEDHQKNLRSFFAAHNGREIKSMGDAFLVEFASALEAVRCATLIQSTSHKKNLKRPPEKRIQLRIGLHLGDVVHSADGDVYGDAVNVASRIEPLADPGGIFLTQQVYDNIKNKLSNPVARVGTKQLKNVEEPVEIYKVVPTWQENGREAHSMNTMLDRNRITVLPFRSMSPDPNDEYFADGMTEELITALSSIKELSVLARTTVMQYKGVPKKISEIGRELNSGSLIEGSVRKAGNKVRISVQLVSAQDESHLWAQNYDKQLDDILKVQSDIAKRVARALRVRLLERETKVIEDRASINADAYNLYLKGRFLWNRRSRKSVKEAVKLFDQAIKLDRSFALGYSGLADSYFILAHNEGEDLAANYERAKQNTMKALELDSNLAEAHTTLAAILYSYNYDYERAEKEFKKSIELKPSYATAHQWYSLLLQIFERYEEAYSELMTARELDPLSLIIKSNIADYYDTLGDYDRAIVEYKGILESAPDFMMARYGLAFIYCEKGMFDDALTELNVSKQIEPERKIEHAAFLPYIYAKMGRTEEARALLKGLSLENPEEQKRVAFMLAVDLAVLGETDAAFIWLNKAVDERQPVAQHIKQEPDLAKLRSDERYQLLLKRLNLK